MKASTIWRYLLLVLCLAVLGVFLVWPVLLTVSGGFQAKLADGTTTWTFDHILSVFRDPLAREGLVNSFIIAVLVTVLCLLISLPLAVIATRYDFPGKAIFAGLLLVPLILPPFVGVIGLRLLLGRFGAFNALLTDLGLVDPANPVDFLGGARMVGVVIMEALHLYPIVYLNVTAALANLDPAMEQAADNLGAGRWTRFRRIVFPLIRPGVFAGCTIVFVWAFTELGTPLMFDFYTVTPVQIFWGIQEMEASSRPYALVVVMLVAAGLLYTLGKVLFGGRAYAATTRAAVGEKARRLGLFKGLVALAPFVAVTGLAILPHLGVVFASITEPVSWYRSVLPTEWTDRHFITALTHPLASGSIRNSLVYSILAMAVDIVLGLTIAYIIVRGRVIGAKLLDGLAMLPLAVPGLVMAFGYVAISLHLNDWAAQLSLTLADWGYPTPIAVPNWLQVMGDAPNPIVFLVIAYAVRRMPYVVRSAVAGLEQTPLDLEEAAAVFGASKLYTIRRIVMPLIMANLIAGGLLAFSFAMLEVSDSLILAQTAQHYPITKAIYTLFERLGDGPYIASAMGVWGMALLAVTLIGASFLLGKKMGAIFRI